MKIAIITSGILPVPAVQGGAVENLIDYYLEYNEAHQLHDITIFSVYHPLVKKHPAFQSKSNHYCYINMHSFSSRIGARIYGYFHKKECYSYKLEYFFEKVYQHIKKQNYDVIILENRPGFALKLHKRVNSRIVTHLHTNMLYGTDEKTRKIVQANDKFIVVSNFIKEEVKTVEVPVPIDVVYNGLNTQLFNIQNTSPVLRKDIGMNKDDFIAVYSGRLVPDKGIKELLQAIVLLSQSHTSIKLLVLGGGNFGDDNTQTPFINELCELSKLVKGRVYFTGFIPYSQIPAYLALANVAVVPSKINDAFPTCCLEATSIGLPVIATNDGGIPETLIGQKHILIEKEGDMVHDIAQALITVQENYVFYRGNKLNPAFTKENFSKCFFESIE